MPRSQPFIPSPVKQHDPKKTKTVVHLKHVEQHQKQLEEQISKLLNPPSQSEVSGEACEVVSEEKREDPTTDTGE